MHKIRTVKTLVRLKTTYLKKFLEKWINKHVKLLNICLKQKKYCVYNFPTLFAFVQPIYPNY